MIDIKKLDDNKKSQLIDNLWNDSKSVWSVIEDTYKKNIRTWQNNPEWLEEIPRRRSKARDNRTFLAMESVISNLLGKPSKPNVIPAQETDEAKQIAMDLQDFFLEKYKTLGVKGKMRQGLRNLFLSRFMCLKVFWNHKTDDFDVKPTDPRNVRIDKKANNMFEAEWAIERIPDKSIQQILYDFPDLKEEILKKLGKTEEFVMLNNPTTEWYEAWVDDYVIYKMQDKILDTQSHPYWDHDGLRMTVNERVKLSKFSISDRKSSIKEIKKLQKQRQDDEGKNYEKYLYNHFDRPYIPYIFGSIFKIENKPAGETTLIEQAQPLQDETDKRKRQISDNAEMMNGQYKVDTRFAKISKADAQMAKSDPRGMWYGEGVKDGVSIETGKELPSFIKDDLIHSIIEIDNLFGSQPTFRGERGQQETATGRAILREQSFQRLDELIDLVDNIHLQLYNWWFQMIKVRYTETHLVKYTNKETAPRIIELMRDDPEEGVEIQIIPGQIIPEDKLFKAERAKEEAGMGIIDPLTYFEETQRDNPMKLAKRLEMYKLNPFSILELEEEDIIKIQQASQLFAQPKQENRTQRLNEVNNQIQSIMDSPEFQNQPPDVQNEIVEQLREQLNNLTRAK